jgi:hypothetical protein
MKMKMGRTAMKRKKNKHPIGNFNELEKIRIYMEYHKDEVFTEELMEELAERFLNYHYVRAKIKELYPRIIKTDIMNNVNLIPDNDE